MYFKQVEHLRFCFFITFLMGTYLLGLKAYAQTNGIGVFVSPNTCVALNKGRTCYAKTIINWRSETAGSFCITINASDTPIKCWVDVRKGEFTYEMLSKDKVVIKLHSDTDELVVAKATIEVSWLYAGDNRKRRWRLF